jgi:hypothetical protein
LDPILIEYGNRYGKLAEDYARETFGRWRSGARKMSGLVAKRLFSLLPERMPERKKYELAENIWLHFGPSSHTSYTIGPETQIEEVLQTVVDKLDQVVQQYDIPQNIKNRFAWLSAGDIQVEEQLLNHMRQLQKSLVIQKISDEIPLLQHQIKEHSEITVSAKSDVQVHKHIISITLNKNMGNGITEGLTKTKQPYAWQELLKFIGFIGFLYILYLAWKTSVR